MGVGNGGTEEWEFVFSQYPTAESANEATNFINALACTSQAYLLNRWMHHLLSRGLLYKYIKQQIMFL